MKKAVAVLAAAQLALALQHDMNIKNNSGFATESLI